MGKGTKWIRGGGELKDKDQQFTQREYNTIFVFLFDFSGLLWNFAFNLFPYNKDGIVLNFFVLVLMKIVLFCF